MNRIKIILFFTIFVFLNLISAEDTEVKLTRIPDDVFYKAAIEFAKHFSQESPVPPLGDVKGLMMTPVYGKDKVLLFYDIIAYFGYEKLPDINSILDDINVITRNHFDEGLSSIYDQAINKYLNNKFPAECCEFSLPVYYEVAPGFPPVSFPGGYGWLFSDYINAIYRLMEQFGRDFKWKRDCIILRDNFVFCWAFSIDGNMYVQTAPDRACNNKPMYFIPWDEFMSKYAQDIKEAYKRKKYNTYIDPVEAEKARELWNHLINGEGEVIFGN